MGMTLKAYVGNGGFSLRRIAACRQLLAEFPEEVAWFSETGRAEDMFFGVFGQLSQQFVLPNLRVAADFAWETSLPRMHDLCQGQLPMAIHGYHKCDPEFFDDIILPAALSVQSENKTISAELKRKRCCDFTGQCFRFEGSRTGHATALAHCLSETIFHL